MTFNIAHGRGLSLYQGFVSPEKLRKNLKAIGDFVRESEVDILAMQEVDLNSHWNRGINLLAAIQAASEHPFGIIGINNRREGKKALAYGNALLSRFPISHRENIPFGDAKLGEKGFLYTELKIAGKSAAGDEKILPVVVLHLDFRSTERRIVQLDKLYEYMRYSRPTNPNRLKTIFCGDFNCGPRSVSDAVRQLDEALRRVGDYRIYPVSDPTFPSLWPKQKIDFVFMPATFKVHFCEVPRLLLSDHCPVVIEFDAD